MKFFFEGGGRSELIDQLLHWVRFGGGCTMLMGPEGVGKTFLCGYLQRLIEPEMPVIWVSGNILLSGLEMFPVIAQSLGRGRL